MSKELVSDYLNKFFMNVEKKTKEKEGKDRYFLWTEWYNSWIDLSKWLNGLPKDSLLVNRFLELNKNLLWINNSVLLGAYHQAIRELRFILEFIVQSYYIDEEHINTDINCKIEIIKEVEKRRFSDLISDIGLKNKGELKGLYKKLCKFVHPSYREINTDAGSRIAFWYDKELFDECYTLTNKIMDNTIFILIQFNKEITENIKKDNILMEFLKKRNCNLSLQTLKT